MSNRLERRRFTAERIDVDVMTAATKPARIGERMALGMNAESAVRLDDLTLNAIGDAERALQVSWWQEHGAAHAGGSRAQQARKLETRALFAGN